MSTKPRSVPTAGLLLHTNVERRPLPRETGEQRKPLSRQEKATRSGKLRDPPTRGVGLSTCRGNAGSTRATCANDRDVQARGASDLRSR